MRYNSLRQPRRGASMVPPTLTVTLPNPAGPADEPKPPAAPAAGGLSPRQLAAARLLAAGRAVGAVCAEVGISRQTIARWRRDPAFGAELRRLHDFLAARFAGPA